MMQSEDKPNRYGSRKSHYKNDHDERPKMTPP